MTTVHQVIADLIQQYGGVDKEIAAKLSENEPEAISPQRLGTYKNGTRTPGIKV